MSIATEISRLQTAKADIKAAIEAKGVTVPAAAKLDTYDDYVAQISGGGGGQQVVLSGDTTQTLMWVNASGVWNVAQSGGTTRCYYFVAGAGKYRVVASSMIAITAAVTEIGASGEAASFATGYSGRTTLQPFNEQVYEDIEGAIIIVRGDKANASGAMFPTIIHEP